MNNQASRRIRVSQDHYLYLSNQHIESSGYFAYDDVEHYYDVNTPTATVRCFWQHIASSTRGANLVNIRVCYAEDRGGEDVDTYEEVVDHWCDGTLVTIGSLADLGVHHIYNTPDYRLRLSFEYVVGNVVDQPDCICNLA